jgi:hypothetical protein
MLERSQRLQLARVRTVILTSHVLSSFTIKPLSIKRERFDKIQLGVLNHQPELRHWQVV